MKESELRIGNLVYFKSEDDDFAIELKFDFENGWNMNYIKPIPLTEEWLLKFGFIKFDSEKIYAEWFLDFDGDLKYKIMQDKRYDNTFIMTNEYKPIKLQYIHQLQNLYFALTGEELTTK